MNARQAWNSRKGRSSSWIRTERRQAIYVRDGERCVYCALLRPWRGLTLDHIKPRHKGGTNASRNLVTSCFSCNSKRQHGSLRGFILRIAAETEQDWRQIMARVQAQRRRTLRTRPGCVKEVLRPVAPSPGNPGQDPGDAPNPGVNGMQVTTWKKDRRARFV